MKLYSEIVEDTDARIADRNNPTGLTAADLDAYTNAELATIRKNLVPIDAMGVSQVGDQSYFPLAIDGAADGAIGMATFRTFGILREPNGDWVGLRTATNSIKRAVYYVLIRPNADGTIASVVPTSRQYKPNLPAGWEPLEITCNNNDVMLGVAINTSTKALSVFVAKLNGTFDQTKHQASLLSGITAYTQLVYHQAAIIGNTLYIFQAAVASTQVGFQVYTADVSSAGNGSTIPVTTVTGITSVTGNAGTVTDDLALLAKPGISNAAPSGVLSAAFPRRPRMMSVVKGNVVRLYLEVSTYIATSKFARDGLAIYVGDYDTTAKKFTSGAGTSGLAYQTAADGSVQFVGESFRGAEAADYREGFTRTGPANNACNGMISADGYFFGIYNNNEDYHRAIGYKIANYSGDVFTELAKLTAQGEQPALANVIIPDRLIGPVTTCGHPAFLTKSRVSFSTPDENNPSDRVFAYTDNQYVTTYRYQGDTIDVTGFPPTDQKTTLRRTANQRGFITMMNGASNITYHGGVLHENGLTRQVNVDATTLDDAASGPVVSITAAELDRAGKAALALYTAANKQSSYDKIYTQVIIPPQTDAPALLYVHGVNIANITGNIVVAEITPSARSGVITVGAMRLAAQTPVGNNQNLSPTALTVSGITYSKVSDGWLITGVPNCFINFVGNSYWYEFVLGRKTDGTYGFGGFYNYTQYYGTGSQCWSIHPEWGIGYCLSTTASQMASAAQVFQVVGNTVAALVANKVSAQYMILTAVAAAGYNLYINEAIPILMNGTTYTLAIGKLNLKDVLADPSNKTWYLAIKRTGDAVNLTATTSKQADDPTSLINIGTCVTSDTQITTLTLVKTTMLGPNVITA